MFRASTCPFSGGQIIFSQHLVSSLSVNGCTVTYILLMNKELCIKVGKWNNSIRVVFILWKLHWSWAFRVKLNLKSSVLLNTWFPQSKCVSCFSGCWIMKDHNYAGAKYYDSAVRVFFLVVAVCYDVSVLLAVWKYCAFWMFATACWVMLLQVCGIVVWAVCASCKYNTTWHT
jgi:hypothetical protein